MSERINYEHISRNDLLYKDFEDTHTASSDGITVDIYRLHELTEGHPVEKLSLEAFTNQLSYPCWSVTPNDSTETAERISPQEVVDLIITHGYNEATELNPELAAHIKKIQMADRSYPVLVYEDHIIDGMHRLSQKVISKHLNHGEDFITIKRLRSIPEAAFVTT